MKWLGQYIQDFKARFRSDVYLDSLTTTTDTSVLVVDSNNKVCKNTTTLGGDITSVVAGVGLSGGATSGAATVTVDFSEFSDVTPADGDKLATLDSDGANEQLTTVASLATLYAGTGLTAASSVINVDASQSQITTLAGLTSFGAADATTNIAAGDLTMYNAVNDGNPTISLGSSATNRLEIKSTYNSGAQTLCDVNFTTYTSSGTTNDGRFVFEVDDVEVLRLIDSGVTSAGNVTCNNGFLAATNTTTSSATQGGALKLISNDGAAMADNHRLGVIEFKGAEDASSTNSIGARIQAVARDTWDGSNNDADLEFYTTDGTTESKVLTLDADKLATFEGTVKGTPIHYPFRGFCLGIASGNFQYAEDPGDPHYPFQLTTDYGDTVIADGSLDDVSTWFRSSGAVMPRACTAVDLVGWASCPGTGEVTISLCKITPGRDSTAAEVPIVVATTTFTALNSNDKIEDFSVGDSGGDGAVTIVTSAIAKGDILMPFVLSPNAKTTYFNMTLEVKG